MPTSSPPAAAVYRALYLRDWNPVKLDHSITMTRYHQTVLVSCETPWDEKYCLHETAFRNQIRFVRKAGFNDLYIFGSAGEGYGVTDSQFRRVAEVFWDENGDHAAQQMVGVIALSTGIVLERLAVAYDIGFRRFQITLPCWGALNDTELMTFFTEVCGAFPDGKFLHYNVPRARRILTGKDYRRLIDAVPNLVATKSTFGGSAQADDLMIRAPELQHFFGEENFSQGCLHGECSLLGSLAALAPESTWAYFRAGQERRVEDLFQYHRFFYRLFYDLFGDFVGLQRINGAYDKILKRLGGVEDFPLRLLSPYEPFTEEQYEVLRNRYVHEFNSGKFERA